MSLDIVFLSTWEAPCGIASYTKNLTEALRARGEQVTILAEALDHAEPFADPRAFPVWRRGFAYKSLHGLDAVARAITTAQTPPQVLHIQHEFGLFPRTSDLAQLTTLLLTHSIYPIITLHTVLPHPQMCDLRHWLGRRFAGKIIVHSDEAAAALDVDCSKVHVIPHGIRVVAALDPQECRETLQLPPNLPIVLCPGFISESKGHAEIIEAIAGCRHDVLCLIVGECRNELYREKLEAKIRHFDVTNRVHIYDGYRTTADMDRYFTAADCIILGATVKPGDPAPYSASGQLADAVAHRKPVIAKNVPIYHSNHALHYQNAAECTRLINYLVQRPKLRFSLDTLLHNWTHVAEAHIKIYENCSRLAT